MIKLKDMVFGLKAVNEPIKKKINEAEMTIRSVYYSLGDAIENLGWLANRNTNYTKDRKLKAIINKLYKLDDELTKHLDKQYKGWD